MTPAAAPAYSLDELIRACGQDGRVIVWPAAVKDARADFGLATEGEVRRFINGGGLEAAQHTDTRVLDKYKAPGPAPLVDSYDFTTGRISGYIAFYQAPITGAWLIKSFKKNLVQGPGQDPLMQSPFRALLDRGTK